MANHPEIRLDLKQTSQSICESWMIVRYDNANGGGNHNLSRLSVRRPNQYLWHFGAALNSTLGGSLLKSGRFRFSDFSNEITERGYTPPLNGKKWRITGGVNGRR